jgi:hypothetical protein
MFQPSPCIKDIAALTNHHTIISELKIRAMNTGSSYYITKHKLGGSNPVGESPPMGREDFHHYCLHGWCS